MLKVAPMFKNMMTRRRGGRRGSWGQVWHPEGSGRGRWTRQGLGKGHVVGQGRWQRRIWRKAVYRSPPSKDWFVYICWKRPYFCDFFFIQCMFRALLTCLGEFNHVASPVNCINCTVINPTVGKKGPNFRDLFGSLLGPYLYFSVFAKFTRRMSIQSSCTQQWENLICSWWENSCTISVCWELMHHMLTPAFWFLPLLMC